MSKVRDAAHFDGKARQWDADPVFRERAKRIAQAIRARIPLSRQMRALDCSSGTGLMSLCPQETLGHITLMDSSASMLAVAEEKIAASGLTHIETRQIDLTADPPTDARRPS